MVFPTKALFRISFRPIQELPIESNPNCSVNWLTVQKVKTAKKSSIFHNMIGQYSVAIYIVILGFWRWGKNTPDDVTFEDSHKL